MLDASVRVFAHYLTYTHTQNAIRMGNIIYPFICFLNWDVIDFLFMDHSLAMAKGLVYSMKLWAMPCGAIQDRQIIVENANQTCSTGGGNDEPLQCSCCEDPMNSMKRQKDRTPEYESPISGGVKYAIEEEQRAITNSFRKNEAVGTKQKHTQLWICVVVKVKSNGVNNIAWEPGMLGPWIKVNWMASTRWQERASTS